MVFYEELTKYINSGDKKFWSKAATFD